MLKCISPHIKKTYVGYTNDLHARLIKHNTNKGAKATKGYKWKIIYKKKNGKTIPLSTVVDRNLLERKRICEFNNIKCFI